MKQKAADASINDVLAEVRVLNGRFDGLEVRFDELGEAVQDFATQVDGRFDNLERDVGTLKGDVTKIKATMVTKDYLDEKLAVHHSDLVLRMQKEDKKTLEMARGR